MTFQKFIVTTRPEAKDNAGYSSRCFAIVNVPVTSLKLNKDLDDAKIRNFKPDVVIFTSAYGTQTALDRFPDIFATKPEAVAIGEKTAEALVAAGLPCRLPEVRTSEGVIEIIRNNAWQNMKIILFTSSKSNRIIENFLADHGYFFIPVRLYDAVPVDSTAFIQQISSPSCFGVIITSSHEAKVVHAALSDGKINTALLRNVKFFAIGAPTARTMLELNLKVSDPPGESDIRELLTKIDHIYCGRK